MFYLIFKSLAAVDNVIGVILQDQSALMTRVRCRISEMKDTNILFNAFAKVFYLNISLILPVAAGFFVGGGEGCAAAGRLEGRGYRHGPSSVAQVSRHVEYHGG